MATTNIELDIENITGVADADDQFIISAQKSVASSIPKDLLWFASTSSTIADGTGIDIDTSDAVLSVDRNGYPSSRVPFSMSKWIDDSVSMHKATALHPKHYDKGGKIYIKPDPDGSNTGTAQYVDYSQLDDDCDLRNAVIFRASSQEFTQLATDGLPSWTSPMSPIAPSSPDFGGDLSISSSSPVVPTISASTVDTSGWTSPTYTKPSLSLTGNPSIADLSIDAVLPISPESPSFDTGAISVSASAPTYSKPSLSLSTLSAISDVSVSAIIPVSPSLSSSSVSFSTTAPTYAKPTTSLTTFPTLTYSYPSVPIMPIISASTSSLLTWDGGGDGGIVIDTVSISTPPVYTAATLESRVAFTDYTSGLSETDPGVLSISATAPMAPSSPSFTTPDVGSVTISNIGTPPSYTKPTVGGTADELTDITELDTENTIDVFDGNSIEVDQWFATLAHLIEGEEDTELASAQVQKISTYISAYSQEMQNQLNVFNDANAEYQAKLQEAIQQAQINAQEAQQEANLKLQKEQQEYSSKLQKFQAEVGQYQADVVKEVQEYTQQLALYQNELNVSFQAWGKEETDKIQRYQQESQSAVAAFNDDNAEYQVTLQVALQNAQLAATGDGLLLQEFGHQLASYNNQVNKIVSGNQSEVTEWQQRNAVLLQEYGADIQNELNEFNKESVEYQAQLQISIQNAQLESADDAQLLQKYSNDVQSYQALVNDEIQEFTSNVQKDIQIYQSENQSKVAEFQNAIQNELNEFNQEQTVYQNELQEKIQESTNQQTKDAQEYSSKLQKYSSLIQSYQQDVNKQVQQYTINELQKELAIWNTNIQSDLQTYTSDMQNELNEFNKESQIYQAEVQASIQDAQLESAEEGQKIQKYSAELNGYQQDINKEVQDFVNTLNKEVQEYQSKVALYSSDIQKYQFDIAEKTQESNVSTQNIQYYDKQADKYYQWSLGEVQQYIQNNSRMINKTIAAQAAQQQQ